MKRTKKEVLNLYNEYLNGATQVQLNKKYKTDTGYLFKKYNLKSRTPSESRIRFRHTGIKLNYNFKSISNEYEAYIVGMFLADGWVNKNQLGLTLKQSDKKLLKEIKNYFSKDITLQKDKNSYKFVISSTQACINAINLGIVRNKSKKQISIPEMDEKLLRHFIRGYFDGDGTVFKCYNKYLKSNICSTTINILKSIQKILKDNNIYSTINIEKRVGKKMNLPNNKSCIAKADIYRLFIRRKNDLKKFFDYLYLDSNIYLERKYNVFNNNKKMLIKLK